MTTTTFLDGQTPIIADWLNDVDAHTYDQLGGAHIAAHITFTPAGNIVATDVQSAITEVESDAATALTTGLATKQPLDTELTALAGLISAANKVPMFSGSGTATTIDFLDEDAMTSNSATAVPSQQSVKAYVDGFSQTSGIWTPTFTANSGLTGSTNGSGRYQKIGSIVFFSVIISVTLSVSGAIGNFSITLPVASNFTNSVSDATVTLSGITSTGALGISGMGYADTTNYVIDCEVVYGNTSTSNVFLTGSYIIK